jgi:uncharacterized protein (DUF927 family)
MGIFEQLHGFSTPEAFSRRLKEQTELNYGMASRAFLVDLADQLADGGCDELVADVVAARTEFVARCVPAGASGQVLSVAGRFALIGMAGELATSMGITGWPEGEAMRCARQCFDAWLDKRGGAGAREIEGGIAQVRSFIAAHGSSRFETPWEGDQRVFNRAGFKKRANTSLSAPWAYYITTSTWKDEVCKGYDARLIAKELVARGLLEPDPKGKHAQSVAVPGVGQLRVYHLKAAILTTPAEDDDRG